MDNEIQKLINKIDSDFSEISDAAEIIKTSTKINEALFSELENTRISLSKNLEQMNSILEKSNIDIRLQEMANQMTNEKFAEKFELILTKVEDTKSKISEQNFGENFELIHSQNSISRERLDNNFVRTNENLITTSTNLEGNHIETKGLLADFKQSILIKFIEQERIQKNGQESLDRIIKETHNTQNDKLIEYGKDIKFIKAFLIIALILVFVVVFAIFI